MSTSLQVPLTLSSEQVSEVVSSKVKEDAAAVLLLGGPEEFMVSPLLKDPNVSRSLLLGLLVLACFPESGEGRGVNQVARALGLVTPTTHRYIRTLCSVGLLEQDASTRKYRRVDPNRRGAQGKQSR